VRSAPAVPTLDLIQGTLTVNGQAGSGDQLHLSDLGNTFDVGQFYTVTATSVSRVAAAPINYAAVQSVLIEGSHFDDLFSVLCTRAGTSVSLHEARANDVVVVGSNKNSPTSTLDLIQGALTLDGGSLGFDNDSIFLNDRGNRSGQTFTITST